MNYENLIESMCYTFRHDFGLLSSPEKESIRRQISQLVENDVKKFINQRKCSNCLYYRDDTKVFKGKFVCVHIDDNYTQHYAGYFMPPPEHHCSEWVEKK